MKTFDKEYKELLRWYFSEQDRIEKNTKQQESGLDGEYTNAVRKVTSEYRVKLNALKEKYEK